LGQPTGCSQEEERWLNLCKLRPVFQGSRLTYDYVINRDLDPSILDATNSWCFTGASSPQNNVFALSGCELCMLSIVLVIWPLGTCIGAQDHKKSSLTNHYQTSPESVPQHPFLRPLEYRLFRTNSLAVKRTPRRESSNRPSMQ